MKAPDWYDAWCEEAFAALRIKQERITEDYRLDKWERFDFDADAATLTFSDGGRPKLVADMQILGTAVGQTWLWGWANESWPASSTAGIKPVVDFGAEHGIEELTTDYLRSDDDPDGVGWMLTAIAARILDAAGAYRAPIPTGSAFLILRSLKFVS